MFQWILLAVIVGLSLDYWMRNRHLKEGLLDCTDLQDASPSPLNDADTTEDTPWLASLSELDRVARHMNACTLMGERPGPAGTRLQTVARTCESGLPHTADGDRIRIPDGIPEALRKPIIDHEMIHIWQRRAPDAFADFYRRQWSFDLRTQPPPGLPATVLKARRSNPDTWRQPWARWMARWWPMAVYTNPGAPRLRESHTVWFDEYTQSVSDQPPTEWTEFFGSPPQNEHPHELAAVYLSDPLFANLSEASRRVGVWWNLQSAKIMSSL